VFCCFWVVLGCFVGVICGVVVWVFLLWLEDNKGERCVSLLLSLLSSSLGDDRKSELLGLPSLRHHALMLDKILANPNRNPHKQTQLNTYLFR